MASQPLGPFHAISRVNRVEIWVVPNCGAAEWDTPQDLPLGGLGKKFWIVIADLELGCTHSLMGVKGVSPLGDEIWKRLLLLGVAWDLFPAPSGLKLFHISFGVGFSFIRWIRFVSI